MLTEVQNFLLYLSFRVSFEPIWNNSIIQKCTTVDPNESDYDGRTALHLAASEGNMEILKYLV